jgi:histone H3/H4
MESCKSLPFEGILRQYLMAFVNSQMVAGAYSQIQSIINQYAAGLVDKAFSCADNSG